MRRPRAGRPFELVRGVPTALVRALDTGAEIPDEWRRPVRIVIYSARDAGALVTLGEADDYVAALQRVVTAFDFEDGGDPGAYPLASPETLALVATLRSAALRELCLMIENTLTPLWPEELGSALYLDGIEAAFPGERLVVGWEATGPMIDLAWAFLVHNLGP